MTYAPQTRVHRAGVVSMNAAEGARERIAFVGNGDQMHMIRHKAVGENSHTVVAGIVQQKVEVKLIVFSPEVRLLTIVTALGNMVWNSRQHNTGSSWHMLTSVDAMSELSPKLDARSPSRSLE